MIRTPIAIVGASCVLPGAPNIAAFERLVLEGKDAVQNAPEGRFGMPNGSVLGQGRDRAWSLAGGYVTDFRPNLDGIDVPGLAGLDPLVHWLLHCAREALGSGNGARAGAVFGNLSFPTDGMAKWGEAQVVGGEGGDPRNHFMSGMPAAIVARALGLEAGATALDAACASSLYAIKLACDSLQSRRTDRMLAGAVQRADSLFLHIGFCQLGAMSKTGQSRPFHAGADGLVPAEGCVVFNLRRLEDAVAAGEPILGVIRGIGLSNDGRGRSLLAPSSEGQVRSMRSALAEADWAPESVQLFECHATGTPTGDRAEIDSLKAVYPGGALGSLKSNVGHLITTAGAAGLLKVLVGLRHSVMPATLHVDHPLADLGDFSLLVQAHPWHAPDSGPRRAAVSAFGFGGNNAHLLVEEYLPVSSAVPSPPVRARQPLAVLSLVEQRGGTEGFVALEGIRFPPSDLAGALAQQNWLLQTGRQAWAQAGLSIKRERLGTYIGMGTDGFVTRWGLRWRRFGVDTFDTSLNVSADDVAPGLRAEHVVGTMPNIVANRLGVQVDAAGPGFTLSADEVSGLRALDAAWDALDRGEIDAAIVGAVDLPNELRATAARRAMGFTESVEDAVVVLVLVRAEGVPEKQSLAYCDDAVEGPVVNPRPPRHGAADGLIALADAIRRGGASVVQVESIGGERAMVGVRTGKRRLEGKSGTASVPPTGPKLTFALHPPEPTIRRASAHSPAPAPTRRLAAVAVENTLLLKENAMRGPTLMPRPPRLVPVLGVAPPAAYTTFAAPAESPTGPVPHFSSMIAQEPAPVDAHAQAFIALSAATSFAHQQFLAQQAALHTAFVQQHARNASQAWTILSLPSPGDSTALEQATTTVAYADPPAAPASPPLMPPSAPVAVRPALPASETAPRAIPKTTVAASSEPEFARPTPSGFTLSRAQLEMGACGSISTIFGPQFAELDGFKRVVRMPEPPLLLADRVIDLQGPCRVLGKGSIVTETDIKADSWYLHDGRMPGGLMIESGQADLLLGSWQGIDWLNQGERIYRLLGCTLTYKGELPKVGETLRYDIYIDQHAKLGDVRMFFFRYDCHVGNGHRLSVREGQAGFFSDEELRNSGGCLWEAETHDYGTASVDAPRATPTNTTLNRSQLDAFAAGDLVAAFGPGFGRAQTHTLTPKIAGGRATLFDRAEFDLAGGPAKRGYLKAELDIRPDLWFFHGHFHNDPCMPGTLMFDGCLNAMYLLLAAGGHTLHRDGWRFEPGKDVPFKLRCRGQVTPTSKRLTYEIFVTELSAGPIPRLTAQVLCTVDGLKCFHADPMIVELVPGWPLDRPDFRAAALPALPPPAVKPAFDYASLLACAWGRPTDAFGPMYQPFDSHRKVPRLPGPPYHFMSRVSQTTGEMGGKKADCSATVEYVVPPDAWYFAQNGHPVMPWAVLLEAALQPCGWLASWTGSAVGPDDFLFRNLDGTATIHREVRPDSGTLTTVAKLTRVSKSAGMILVTFVVTVDSSEGRVVDMNTVFGFFPPEAFVNQVGVGSTEVERLRLSAPAEVVDMRPPQGAAIATDRLLVVDRVYRIDADTYRGEKDVSPKDWFFAAHFYQDPVQPGSLGIEALLQLLQVAMQDRGLAKRFAKPRFEPTANGEAQTWKYRGQVVPENKLIQSELRMLEVREEAEGTLVIAEGGLWVDGKRIYALPKFAMRVRNDERPDRVLLPVPADHQPTWTVPAAPMMTMALTALSATGAARIENGLARKWLTFADGKPASVELHVQPTEIGHDVVLGNPGQPFFTAQTLANAGSPAELPDLVDSQAGPGPAHTLYSSGALFHGPTFQALSAVNAVGKNGASGTLAAGLAPDVLLDGMTHLVPHDAMESWFPALPAGNAAYPARLQSLNLHGALPVGTSRVEVRALRVEKGRPVVGAWLFEGERLVASFELEEVLLPKGRIGAAPPEARRAFLQRRYMPDVSLSRFEGQTAFLSQNDIRGSDWLPGTVRAVFGADQAAEVAVKEAVGRALACHPGVVEVGDVSLQTAFARTRPLHSVPFKLVQSASGAQATPGEVVFPDISRVSRWWRSRLQAGPWPGEQVLESLCRAYCADFTVHDPDAVRVIDGPILFLANHENYLESVIFSAIAAAIFDRPLRAVAKVEHQTRWLGQLHGLLTGYPGMRQDPQIVWFDQANPASLRPTLDAVPAGTSLLVHVEGSRQTRHGELVSKVSSVWADFAVDRGWTVVPVAFRGGTAGQKTDVPVAPQHHHIGAPIPAAVLKSLPYAARRQTIADAINALPHGDVPAASIATVRNPGEAIHASIERFAPNALAKADPGWAARFRSL